MSKEGFWERGGGSLQNCLALCVFEKCFKVLELGITVLVFGPESWGVARNVESLGLGVLLFSCEPLCSWISGKFSAASRDPQPSGAHIVHSQHVWKGCFNVLQVELLLCLSELAQIQ